MATQKNHLPDVHIAGVNFQPSGIVTKTADEFVSQNIDRHFTDKKPEEREKLLREVHAKCLEHASDKEQPNAKGSNGKKK